MLRGLRKGASSIFAKALLFLLVASFALWGIGDIFRDSGANATLATAGADVITAQEFQVSLQKIQQSYGDLMTPEMMQQTQLPLMLLQQMINGRLLEQEAKQLGVRISDDALLRHIRNNPAFQKEDGSFDRVRFALSLQTNQMNEAMYLATLRENLSADILRDMFFVSPLISDDIVKALYQARAEERAAGIILIGGQDISADEPTDDELQEFYDATAAAYIQPEYRTIRIASVPATALTQQVRANVTEEDIAQYYEDNQSMFTVPEKRNVEQWLYKTESEATEAYKQLLEGKAAESVISTYPPVNADNTALGNVAYKSLPDEAKDPVFSVEAGQFTNPIETAFGWHVFLVKDVTPAQTKPMDEVKDAIIDQYVAAASETHVRKTANVLDDALAGGATLEEAFETAQLDATITEIGPVDANGLNQKEEAVQVDALPNAALQTGFSLGVNETSRLALSDDNEYFLIQTKSIIGERQPALDEVRAQITQAWKKQQRAQKLRIKAQAIAAELKTADNVQAVLDEKGLSTQSTGRIARYQDTVTNNSALKDKILTSGFVMELFNLQKGDITNAYPLPNGEYAVGVLSDIFPAEDDPSAADLAEIRSELKQAMPEELYSQYIVALRQAHGVSINQDVLAQLLQ